MNSIAEDKKSKLLMMAKKRLEKYQQEKSNSTRTNSTSTGAMKSTSNGTAQPNVSAGTITNTNTISSPTSVKPAGAPAYTRPNSSIHFSTKRIPNNVSTATSPTDHELEQLKQAVKEKDFTLKTQSEQLNNYKLEVENYLKMNQFLQKQLDSKQQEFNEEKKAQLAQLENEHLNQVNQMKVEHSLEIERLNKEHSLAIELLQKENSSTIERLTLDHQQKIQHYIEDATSKSKLDTELSNTRSALATKNQEYSILKQENMGLFEQIKELRDKIVEITNESASKQIQNQTLVSALEKQLKTNSISFQKDLHDFEKKLNLAEQENLLLRQQLSSIPSTSNTANASTATESSTVNAETNTATIETLNNNNNNNISNEVLRYKKELNSLRSRLDQALYLNEHLQMELETVPDYISKYHQERRIIKSKQLMKDRVLVKLCEEYEKLSNSMQQNLGLDSKAGLDLIRLVDDVMLEEHEELEQVDLNSSVNNGGVAAIINNTNNSSNLISHIIKSKLHQNEEILFKGCDHCTGQVSEL